MSEQIRRELTAKLAYQTYSYRAGGVELPFEHLPANQRQAWIDVLVFIEENAHDMFDPDCPLCGKQMECPDCDGPICSSCMGPIGSTPTCQDCLDKAIARTKKKKHKLQTVSERSTTQR